MAHTTCPRCWRTFPHETRVCPEDGNLLVASELLARHAPLTPGAMVGDYRIEGILGEGGMGEVYRAVQPLIERRVAIKVLKSTQRELIGRFIREARSVNQIRHRNLIDIFTFGQLPDGRCYFVMEYLEGSSLADAMRDRGPLPIGESMRILRSLAATLDVVHARDVAHRDLKPANVFLEEESSGPPRVKLLDFGIAKLLGPDEAPGDLTELQTKPGVFMGTPQYMAPELFSGGPIDFKQVDRYALGVIAYQMITGALPHQGERFGELVANILLAPALPPSQVASLPPAVDAPLLTAIARDPARRFDRATAMVDALERAIRDAGGEGAVDALRMGGEKPSRARKGAVSDNTMPESSSPDSSGPFIASSTPPGRAHRSEDTLLDPAPPGWSSPPTLAGSPGGVPSPRALQTARDDQLPPLAPHAAMDDREPPRAPQTVIDDRASLKAPQAAHSERAAVRGDSRHRWFWTASAVLALGIGTFAALRRPEVSGTHEPASGSTTEPSPLAAPVSPAQEPDTSPDAAPHRGDTAAPPTKAPADRTDSRTSAAPARKREGSIAAAPSPQPRSVAPTVASPDAVGTAAPASTPASTPPARSVASAGPLRLGRIQVGVKLPRVAGLTLNGHSAISTDALLKQPGASGLLVQLWATWCAPCVDELVQLSAGRQRLDEAGMRVLLVNVLEEPEVIEPFVSRHGLEVFPLIRDATGATLERLGLRASGETAVTLPLSIVTDEQGVVQAILTRGSARYVDHVLETR